MLDTQVNTTELNARHLTNASLLLLKLIRDLAVLEKELLTVEDAMGRPVLSYRDPLAERLSRAGVNNQKVEDFIAWRRTISSLIADGCCDENKLAKIAETEASGVKVFAELIAAIKSGEDHGRLPALAA